MWNDPDVRFIPPFPPAHFTAERGEDGYVELIPRTPIHRRGGGSTLAFCLPAIEARGLAHQLLAACDAMVPPNPAHDHGNPHGRNRR